MNRSGTSRETGWNGIYNTDPVKLPASFYTRPDVVRIARELLGKYLFTFIDGIYTGGIITETEAYNGETDRASHAFGGRRTARTEIMYATGGTAYVYLCYGIHSLFNVVTNKKNIPHAILVRAIYPTEGIEQMRIRRRKPKSKIEELCIGPGTVSQALGIHFSHTGKSLSGNEIWIEDKALKIPDNKVITGPRVGVDYAGKDALLPYRFRVLHNYFLTGLIVLFCRASFPGM
jgi:DNA-3-methyladenine glycosylase